MDSIFTMYTFSKCLLKSKFQYSLFPFNFFPSFFQKKIAKNFGGEMCWGKTDRERNDPGAKKWRDERWG